MQLLNKRHRLVLDQSVYVVLRPVFARRHFKHVRNTQQRLLRVFVSDNLTADRNNIIAINKLAVGDISSRQGERL